MHRSDFDIGLERIKRTFPKLDDGTIDELERRWMGLDAILWKAMCQWVIEGSTFTPKPAKFKEAHGACRMSWRDINVSSTKRECPNCMNSSGFKWIHYRANTGFPYSGIVPCMNCNREQVIPKSDIKIESLIPDAEWDEICHNPEPEAVFLEGKAGVVLDRHGRGPTERGEAIRRAKWEVVSANKQVAQKMTAVLVPQVEQLQEAKAKIASQIAEDVARREAEGEDIPF